MYLATDITIVEWIKARLPEQADFIDPELCIGVYSSAGKLLAGVVFQNYCEMAGMLRAFQVELTCVADSARWATKNIIRKILDFAFNTLRCNRIVTLTERGNERAIRFNRGIGFVHEGTLRQAFNGKDVEIHSLLKDEFLAGKYGKHS